MVKIGDFLHRKKVPVEILDDKYYKRVTIKINNGGVFLRDNVKGENIGTKNQFIISKGQFLVSKIDARNGAFGVVPESLDGAVITGNFWVFDVDYSKINPHFLTLIATTREFIEFCQNASNGTTNRHYLQESLFLAQQIPLPTLAKQNGIVNSYNKKINSARSLDQRISKLEFEKSDYLFQILGITRTETIALKKGLNLIGYSSINKWSISHNKKQHLYDFEQANFSKKLIKDLLTFFEGGKTPSKTRADFWDGEIYWTSPKDFNGLVINSAEDKITKLALQESKMKIYPIGTILSVFRSGILRHSFPTAITSVETTINQDLKAYGVKESILNSYYLLYFINIFKEYFLKSASKKSVTVESINTEDFLNIAIPVPPLEIQKEIVKRITTYDQEINELKLNAIENRKNSMSQFEEEIFGS